jgi:hypothetical protein
LLAEFRLSPQANANLPIQPRDHRSENFNFARRECPRCNKFLPPRTQNPSKEAHAIMDSRRGGTHRIEYVDNPVRKRL